MKKNYQLATILLIILFVIPIAILSYTFKSDNIWSGLTLGVAGMYEEYCELNRMEDFLRERMNSWSNLAFVWFGLVCLLNGLRPNQNRKNKNVIHQYPVLSVFTGLSFMYLGIGSFLYHAALTRFTQLLDVAGTYAAVNAIVGLGILSVLQIYLPKDKKGPVGLMIVLIIIADVFFFVYKWQLDANVVLPIMVVILLMVTIGVSISKHLKGNLILAILGFIAVCVAFYIRNLDVNKVFCNPESLLQGHSIWHLLTGSSLFLMYNYFRGISIKTEFQT
ncbi:MAG: ceramidase domain-containing protein [Chitinophagales bacterium]